MCWATQKWLRVLYELVVYFTSNAYARGTHMGTVYEFERWWRHTSMALCAQIEDAGRCRPLWNLYESLFQTSICRYTVDTFVSVWRHTDSHTLFSAATINAFVTNFMVWFFSCVFQNGFWLCVSWCVVFMMPCLVLNVKLARHYRRMKYLDNYIDLWVFA